MINFKQVVVCILLVVCTLNSYGQNTGKEEIDSIKTFSLGEVVVMEKLPASAGTEISSLEIKQMDITKVPEALEWIPGITLTEASSRGETMIYLRGFNQSRIPVYMDGIPVSVPFDGFIDLGRLQTASVSKIHVSKGISSLLLGGNTMGSCKYHQCVTNQ